MRYNQLLYILPFGFAYAFFVALVYAVSDNYGIYNDLTFPIYFLGFLLLIYSLHFAPSIILHGRRARKLDSVFLSKLVGIQSTIPNLNSMQIEFVRIEGNNVDICLISHPTRTLMIFTDAALTKLNEVDFEAVFAFFAARICRQNEYLATVYLLIASLLEKAIIGKLGVALIMNLTISNLERVEFDRQAITYTRNPIGYRNMLNKGNTEGYKIQGLPGVLGTVSIFGTSDRSDIAIRTAAITSR